MFVILAAGSGCRDSSASGGFETRPFESSDVVAQGESWQVQLLVNGSCWPLQANALSDDETVVGVCRLPNHTLNAYRWKNGVLAVLPMATTGYSNALAVNNAGQVVGEVQSHPPEPSRAFIWSADGIVTILPKLDAAIQSDRAWGINSAGVIVGEGCCPTRAIAWTFANGAWSASSIGTLGAADDRAFAINDAGIIVGTSTATDGVRRAWRAPLGGAMQLLGTLGKSTDASGASDINRASTIVGDGEYGASQMYFVWKWNTGMKNTGLTGGNFGLGHSFGVSISDKERIAATVIGEKPYTQRGATAAFLPLPVGTPVGDATDVNTCGTVTGIAGFGANGALLWRRYVGGKRVCD
jgi:probable HAF family extracellular repeat protein